MNTNIKIKEGFQQVCVWPGVLVREGEEKDVTDFFLKEMSTRIQFLETIVTEPDMEDGYPVEGTGGRHDILFAVHNDDVANFAVPRLKMGIRWIEDVYGNGHGDIYPDRVSEYRCWKY